MYSRLAERRAAPSKTLHCAKWCAQAAPAPAPQGVVQATTTTVLRHSYRARLSSRYAWVTHIQVMFQRGAGGCCHSVLPAAPPVEPAAADGRFWSFVAAAAAHSPLSHRCRCLQHKGKQQ